MQCCNRSWYILWGVLSSFEGEKRAEMHRAT